MSSSLSAPSSQVPVSSPNAMQAQQAQAMAAQAQQQFSQSMQQDSHGKPSTNNAAPYLKDFNLVAEAAKRAQMAVLMRDIDEITL